jgi:outer membrane protein
MRLSLVFLLLFLPLEARGASALGFEEACSAAIRHHESLLSARASVDRARAGAAASRSDLLPSVGATGTLQTSGVPGQAMDPSLSAGASLDLAILSPSLWPELRASRSRILAAEAASEGSTLALLHALADAWRSARTADEVLAARERSLALSQDLLAGVEAQVRIGTSIPLAVTRERVTVAEARARVALASRDSRLARLDLRRLTGLDLDGVDLADPGPLPPPPELESTPPAVQQARANLLAAESVLRAARLAPLPKLAGFSDLGWVDAMDATEPTTSLQAGLKASVTLFGGGLLRASIDAAAADRLSARANEQGAIADASLALAVAEASMRTADARVEAQEAAFEAASENLQGVRARLDAGMASAIEVADAISTLADAESNLLLARLERELAQLSAYAARGLPPPGAPAR